MKGCSIIVYDDLKAGYKNHQLLNPFLLSDSDIGAHALQGSPVALQGYCIYVNNGEKAFLVPVSTGGIVWGERYFVAEEALQFIQDGLTKRIGAEGAITMVQYRGGSYIPVVYHPENVRIFSYRATLFQNWNPSTPEYRPPCLIVPEIRVSVINPITGQRESLGSFNSVQDARDWSQVNFDRSVQYVFIDFADKNGPTFAPISVGVWLEGSSGITFYSENSYV